MIQSGVMRRLLLPWGIKTGLLRRGEPIRMEALLMETLLILRRNQSAPFLMQILWVGYWGLGIVIQEGKMCQHLLGTLLREL